MSQQKRLLILRSLAWRNHALKPGGSRARRTMLCPCFGKTTLKRFMRWQIIYSNASTDWWRRFAERFRGAPRGRSLPSKRQIRIDLFSDSRLKPTLQSQQPGKRDHSRVIRAQPRLGIFEFESAAHACLAQLPSQFLIATDPTADRHKIDAVFPCCCNRLAHQDVDNRLLKRSTKIIQQLVILSKREGPLTTAGRIARSLVVFATGDATNFRQQIAHCSFQPAKTKVLRIEHAARQTKTIGITASCMFFNLRAARITEPDHLGNLIERFARSIIDGSAE